MYLEHFALKCHPFRITPDPTFFHTGGGRGEILNALVYAITSGEGIVKVIGEVGSGKTMLCRILEERLPASIEIVYLANPNLSPHDILYAIAFELKLPVTVATERLLVMQHLQAHLLEQHVAGSSVVVFIEEAQGMPLETLEEIRLLSNLETHRHKLLQIVLFGQPELEKKLRQRTIRQLKERITHSFNLEPLTTAEVSEYIRFRLQAAGCDKSAVFSSGAERLIARASCGLIRRINILADKAMLAVYADSNASTLASTTREMVQSRHVRTAINDSEFSLPLSRTIWLAGAGAILLVVILIAVTKWNGRSPLATLPASPTGDSLSMQGPAVGSKGVAPPAKSIGRSLEKSAIEQPTPAKPIKTEEQGAQNPVTGTAVPATPAASSVASLAAVAEAAQKAPVLSGANLMELRRRATVQWLQGINPDEYTIQLITVEVGNDMYLERFLQEIAPASLLKKIYVCPVRQGEHEVWVVVYDAFQGASSARQAIDNLPRKLRRFQPFVRRFGELFHNPRPNDTRT